MGMLSTIVNDDPPVGAPAAPLPTTATERTSLALSRREGRGGEAEAGVRAAASGDVRPCPDCGRGRLWRDGYGGLHCETCLPPATETIVRERVMAEGALPPDPIPPGPWEHWVETDWNGVVYDCWALKGLKWRPSIRSWLSDMPKHARRFRT